MSLRIALHKRLSGGFAALVAFAVALAPFESASAQQGKGPPILRDTETEVLLREYTRPILRAAGLEKQNIQMVIINDASFNAFVADGRRIFVNYGAIMQSENPNQLIGVLAHETGHLAGGHLAKLRQQLATAQTQMIIATILGAGALAVGARGGGNSGLANAGAAALSGPGEVIRRSLLSYQRQQEENADRAGVKLLSATGQSPKGMYDTFKRFTNESLFAARGSDPYLQSHPMPADRVEALEGLARQSPYWDKKDDPALQLRHDMVRAKISAFMERPDTVARRYPLSDNSLPARYARAISTYLHGDLRSALSQIDALIQAQPNNPYFYEVRGQALLEGGRPAEAIAPLRKAVQLSNNGPLIEMLLGQALVASENKAYTDEAISILRAAVARESEAPLGYSQLAMAYGRKGDYAEADLASAQAAFLRGDNKTARELASRAKTRFAVGSPGWVKADDIVTAKPLSGQQNEEITAIIGPDYRDTAHSHRQGPDHLTKRTTFMPSFRTLVPAALLALSFCAAPLVASAESISDSQRGEIETIVRNYLISHPEVLEEAMAELQKRQTAAEAAKHEAGIAKNADTIFNSPRGVVLGNKDGDVTFVEFFDYNCGYCKRAMNDMMELMKSDPKLKVVLKEFPVLSQGSVEAAQVAVAVRMQAPQKYLDFHQKLLGGRGQADKAHALAVAKELGLDMARVEKDMASPEAKATIEENFKLAEEMGMNGTPSYVIGKQVVIGAVGVEGLREKISTARCGKATC